MTQHRLGDFLHQFANMLQGDGLAHARVVEHLHDRRLGL
jgi:hypothetical protein